ncbi:MAG: peptide deformylase [Deltaproteobacteria bacterium]|nr:peptide deformylase [Deltaproteobacteria bacterium]
MAVLHIHKYPEVVLKEKARPVKEITDEIQCLIDDMADTMYQAPGIGLAANQVGALHRVIVFDVTPKEEGRNLCVIINPEIVASEGEVVHQEACLSVSDYSCDVRRKACITVAGLDREGNPLQIEAKDLLAVVLQHEIDHLDGILFIDRISRLRRSLYNRQLKKKNKT